MMRIFVPLIALATLAACTTQPAPRAELPVGQCNAAPAHTVVGRTITPQLQEEASQVAGARLVRVLRPGQVITMEFNPARLTLQLNSDNVVVRATCG